MTLTETVKYTAVPGGRTDFGGALLSVVVSVELTSDPADHASGTLTDFPDFLHWPTTLASLVNYVWEITFASTFQGHAPSVATKPLDTSGLNPALWDALFTPAVDYTQPDAAQAAERRPVPYAAPEAAHETFRTIPIVSYPRNHVGAFLRGQYASYSAKRPPTAQIVSEVYSPVGGLLTGVSAQRARQALAEGRRANSKGGTRPHATDFSGADATQSFAAVTEYQSPGAGTPPSATVPTVDFHRALTFVGQHRTLQRQLGLAFDIPLAFSDLPPWLGHTSEFEGLLVRAVLVNNNGDRPAGRAGTLGATVDYVAQSPVTQFTGGFISYEKPGSLLFSRHLTIGESNNFTIDTIDIDGASSAALSFAANQGLSQAPATSDPDFSNAANAPDPTAVVLPPSQRTNGLTVSENNRGANLADYLTFMYALIDAFVSNQEGPHLSADDTVRGYILDVADVEAPAPAWHSTAERIVTYRVGELSVSTATSAPFDEVAFQSPPRLQTAPDDPSQMQGNVSEVILRWDGWSVAALRPGKPLPDADSQANAPDVPFAQLTITSKVPHGRLLPLRFGRRYQLRARAVDIANNAIPLTQGFGFGNVGIVTPPITYYRREPIAPPDLYGQSAMRLGESLKRLVIRDVDAGTPSRRAIAPGRVSEAFAETMGMFDQADGRPDGSASVHSLIAGRDGATYGVARVPAGTTPTAIALTSPVPYLPDPIARGALLNLLIEGVSAVANADFSPASGAGWPDFRPFGLQLTAGGALGASTDSGDRTVTVTLTPGDTVTAELSATCTDADIALFDPSLLPDFDAAEAAAGHCWLTTPPIQLELAYAVQRPLATPEFPQGLVADDDFGRTFAWIVGALSYSPKSTSTIELLADWGDPVDDPLNGLPVQGPGAPDASLRQTTNSHVETLPSIKAPLLAAGTQATSATDSLTVTHEFHDTKHRNVTYHAIATTRFPECYPAGTDVTVATKAPVTVNVPSSARPDTPRVHSVVPIYPWEPIHRPAGQIVSRRGPSALRVFLERPWWSSGIDELLAVLTWPRAEGLAYEIPDPGGTRKSPFGGAGGRAVTVPDQEALYVTDWGADPVFASRRLPSAHPRLASFPNATTFGTGLTLEEHYVNGSVGTILVNAAGHTVTFDAERKLWYCDIAVDVGACYTPMIRLALARYQPNSRSNTELSRVVLADIMSLEPGRTVTVTRGSGMLHSVVVSGVSYTEAGGMAGTAPGIAELVLERRNPGVADPDLGWDPVGGPFRMEAAHEADGSTAWVARGVPIHSGRHHRLVVSQYEVLPTDRGTPPGERRENEYPLPAPHRNHRLVFQDLVPLRA
jgi:hypothetical protein